MRCTCFYILARGQRKGLTGPWGILSNSAKLSREVLTTEPAAHSAAPPRLPNPRPPAPAVPSRRVRPRPGPSPHEVTATSRARARGSATSPAAPLTPAHVTGLLSPARPAAPLGSPAPRAPGRRSPAPPRPRLQRGPRPHVLLPAQWEPAPGAGRRGGENGSVTLRERGGAGNVGVNEGTQRRQVGAAAVAMTRERCAPLPWPFPPVHPGQRCPGPPRAASCLPSGALFGARS